MSFISYNNLIITSNPASESILDAGAYRAFEGGLEIINNIPVNKRKPGMLVSTNNGDKFYKLNEGPWTQTDSDWTELVFTTTENEVKFIDHEIPTGLIDGTNQTFTLQQLPLSGSDHVYLNGLLQDRGIDSDYIIQDKQIIFSFLLHQGSKLKCSYRYC
tara:strand:+ start:7238 stop:7714 length:477 start_codon:yes stop_codon:yes gene_type:complete